VPQVGAEETPREPTPDALPAAAPAPAPAPNVASEKYQRTDDYDTVSHLIIMSDCYVLIKLFLKHHSPLSSKYILNVRMLYVVVRSVCARARARCRRARRWARKRARRRRRRGARAWVPPPPPPCAAACTSCCSRCPPPRPSGTPPSGSRYAHSPYPFFYSSINFLSCYILRINLLY
jgi:hypothetical protein